MERPTVTLDAEAAVTELLEEGPLVATPPVQQAPMPAQSLAPVSWLVALARWLTPDDGNASLETPP